jgi:hypothetical protein
MARPNFLFAVFCLIALANARAAASPEPVTPPKPVGPSPTPSLSTLIDSLQPADLKQVIPLLKSNFINPNALNETELDRATLQGLIMRLGHGVMLLPDRATAPMDTPSPLYSELLAGHIGYLRPGALTTANLQGMDSALKTFVTQKVDALILDLRATPASNDFATAAEFAKRFSPKGETLFVLRKPSVKQEQIFTSDRDPSYRGLMMVLTDGDTAGAAEALAGTLRNQNKAMIIGQPTAGRAVEYSDLALASGTILRVAVGEVLLPGAKPLYPDGLQPDLLVEMTAADKHQVFEQSLTKGMSGFVFETERPHLNEAALVAGKNPELDAFEARQKGPGAERSAVRDAVVQRAIDLITSLAVYQNR